MLIRSFSLTLGWPFDPLTAAWQGIKTAQGFCGFGVAAEA
jgi:hypothetical protein